MDTILIYSLAYIRKRNTMVEMNDLKRYLAHITHVNMVRQSFEDDEFLSRFSQITFDTTSHAKNDISSKKNPPTNQSV